MKKLPLIIERNERFYAEPKDPHQGSTFANARATEAQHDQLKFDTPDDYEPVLIGGEPHSLYDVTNLGIDVIRNIYATQRWNSLPVVLWHKVGKKPYRRYEPQKAARSFPRLLRRANTAVKKKKAIEKLLGDGIVTRGQKQLPFAEK